MFSAIPEATTHGAEWPREGNARTWYFDTQKTRKNTKVFDAFSELLERHPPRERISLKTSVRGSDRALGMTVKADQGREKNDTPSCAGRHGGGFR